MTLGVGNLAVRSVSTGVSINAGDLLIVTAGTTTQQLPSPSVNAVVGILAASGSISGTNYVVVERTSGAVINTTGAWGATEVLLGTPGAFIFLQSDGTNWYRIAGDQDTGWVPMTLNTGNSIIAVPDWYTPAYRTQGDVTSMRGAAANNGSSLSTGAVWASGLPAPASDVGVSGSNFTIAYGSLAVNTSGQLALNSAAPHATEVSLDGLFYPLR